MHQIVVDLLERFGIAVGWEELDNTESLNEYMTFSIIGPEETNITTEGNLTERYFISINYWYKDLDNINKYKEIKSLLKEHGFISDGIDIDLKSGDIRGKNIDFIYVMDVEE